MPLYLPLILTQWSSDGFFSFFRALGPHSTTVVLVGSRSQHAGTISWVSLPEGYRAEEGETMMRMLVISQCPFVLLGCISLVFSQEALISGHILEKITGTLPSKVSCPASRQHLISCTFHKACGDTRPWFSPLRKFPFPRDFVVILPNTQPCSLGQVPRNWFQDWSRSFVPDQ